MRAREATRDGCADNADADADGRASRKSTDIDCATGASTSKHERADISRCW
jgi:hypothetical protein